MKKQIKKKKKVSKNILKGVVHIHATFNNTIVSISDEAGKIISWSSAGALGYKGTKKSTPYVAQMVSEAAARAAMEHGLKTVRVEVKGPGSGRDSAVLALETAGLKVTEIKDVTPIPHNGTRARKKPRG